MVQWIGGKGAQLESLLPLIPYGDRYIEPYGGGASVLLNRRPSPTEVYNDLNGHIVNLFRVMRDEEQYARFQRYVELTLFSKGEFIHALDLLYGERPTPDPVKRAWATFVIQNQGISGKHHKSQGNWSRSFQDAKNCDRWWKRIERLDAICERLKRVQIDSQDALACMEYWDSPGSVFYVDPPYVLSTRDMTLYYEVEADDDAHEKLVAVLLGLEGAVVLSGYDSPIYTPLVEAGWVVDVYGQAANATVGGNGEAKGRRAEVVWRNPKAAQNSVMIPLF